MPGQDHDEQADQSLPSEEVGEDELSADFLRVSLPERPGEQAPHLGRTIKGEASSRGGEASNLEVHEHLGKSAPAWGDEARAGEEIEEVWDDDPSSPQMVEEEEDEGEEDSEGDEKIRIIKKRKRDAEHSWGGGQRTTLWWVTSGLVAVLVVGLLLVQGGKSGQPPAPVEVPRRTISELSPDDSRVVELLGKGQSRVPELVALIKQAEGPPAEAAKVMVRGSQSVARRDAWRARVGLRAAVKDDGVIRLLGVQLGDLNYLLISGLRDDYTKYIAYILEIDGEMRLDWEASEGYCSLLPEEVMGLGTDQEVEMRALASPSSFYTPVFPESDYVCVLLSHLDQERYAWGYLRRKSPEHDVLASHLASPVADIVAGRVRIRVRRGPEGALPKQVMVTAILGSDWLVGSSPPEGEEATEGGDPGE